MHFLETADSMQRERERERERKRERLGGFLSHLHWSLWCFWHQWNFASGNEQLAHWRAQPEKNFQGNGNHADMICLYSSSTDSYIPRLFEMSTIGNNYKYVKTLFKKSGLEDILWNSSSSCARKVIQKSTSGREKKDAISNLNIHFSVSFRLSAPLLLLLGLPRCHLKKKRHKKSIHFIS
jgi:hypothetical protein